MQNVVENITKQNFDKLVQSEEFVELPQLKGDFANLFEHYLDMVNLLLNMIHFQRANDWEGTLRQLENFYHIVFLVIAIITLEIYHIITSK